MRLEFELIGAINTEIHHKLKINRYDRSQQTEYFARSEKNHKNSLKIPPNYSGSIAVQYCVTALFGKD